MQVDADSPYKPPSASFDDMNEKVVTSRWSMLIAVMLASPYLLIGSFGLIEEIDLRHKRANMEFLFGFSLAIALLIYASASFVVRDVAIKFFKKPRKLALLRIANIAIFYCVPFMLCVICRVLSYSDLYRTIGKSILVLLLIFIFIFLLQFTIMTVLYFIMDWLVRRANKPT